MHEVRRILAEAWRRPVAPGARPGPTDAEREQLTALRKRGRYAPWLGAEDPIPLLPVAQLFRRDVPQLAGPGDADMLQVFWCPFDAHGGNKSLAVTLTWRIASQVTEVLVEQPRLEVVGTSGYVPEPCVLHPEQIVEHQDLTLLPAGLATRLEAMEEDEDEDDEDAVLYQYDLSIAPGWKVGGFAAWNLTGPQRMVCVCGQPVSLLLTMDSKEWDGGSRSWIPAEDRDGRDVPEGGTPTELTLGRWGSLRVFVCSADATHPHQLSEQ